MKHSKVIVLGLVLIISNICLGQTRQLSRRADAQWKPFFAKVQVAVKNRDQAGLMKLMSRDFYYLSSGGDENNNHDTRDEAFDYWKNAAAGSWEALDKVLAEGVAPNQAMREPGNTNPGRVAPPQANDKRAIADRAFAWYAVFEFKNNRWYFTAFTECCE